MEKLFKIKMQNLSQKTFVSKMNIFRVKRGVNTIRIPISCPQNRGIDLKSEPPTRKFHVSDMLLSPNSLFSLGGLWAHKKLVIAFNPAKHFFHQMNSIPETIQHIE